MSTDKNLVIWVENKKEKDIEEVLIKYLGDKGIQLCHVYNVDTFAAKLDEIDNSSRIRGFIIDMMLDGPNNLSSFGLPDIEWGHDETDAGRILIKYVIKADFSEYIEIPTLVLTVRSDIIKESITKYHNTQLITKRDTFAVNWQQDLISWLKAI